jgi:hypothetical protein
MKFQAHIQKLVGNPKIGFLDSLECVLQFEQILICSALDYADCAMWIPRAAAVLRPRLSSISRRSAFISSARLIAATSPASSEGKLSMVFGDRSISQIGGLSINERIA